MKVYIALRTTNLRECPCIYTIIYWISVDINYGNSIKLQNKLDLYGQYAPSNYGDWKFI